MGKTVRLEPDDPRVVRAKERIRKLYERVKKSGGWRRVSAELGLPNASYVVKFMKHNAIPGNPVHRRQMFLPKVLTPKIKPRPARPDYLNWWAHLTKATRHLIIWKQFMNRDSK